MTLNCYKFEFSRDFADLGANDGYMNEDSDRIVIH